MNNNFRYSRKKKLLTVLTTFNLFLKHGVLRTLKSQELLMLRFEISVKKIIECNIEGIVSLIKGV